LHLKLPIGDFPAGFLKDWNDLGLDFLGLNPSVELLAQLLLLVLASSLGRGPEEGAAGGAGEVDRDEGLLRMDGHDVLLLTLLHDHGHVGGALAEIAVQSLLQLLVGHVITTGRRIFAHVLQRGVDCILVLDLGQCLPE